MQLKRGGIIELHISKRNPAQENALFPAKVIGLNAHQIPLPLSVLFSQSSDGQMRLERSMVIFLQMFSAKRWLTHASIPNGNYSIQCSVTFAGYTRALVWPGASSVMKRYNVTA